MKTLFYILSSFLFLSSEYSIALVAAAFSISTSTFSCFAVVRSHPKRLLQRQWQQKQMFTKPSSSNHRYGYLQSTSSLSSSSSDDSIDDSSLDAITISNMSDEEKKNAVGNLVADDEWNGMAMELSEIIRRAVIEDVKTKGREFLGKDEYKIGDITKEIDIRVKEGVANLRGKEEYELGDFVLLMDETSKNMTEKLTGKPYEFGDLSKEIDTRIKKSVANWVGKEEYETGDLTKLIAEKIKNRVDYLTDNYEFGDITREVNRRRKEWMKDYLGEEAYANYQFGDITKKIFTKYTGKEKYEFGDVTKKILGDFFNKKDDKKK